MRVRITGPARGDLESILEVSEARWGAAAQQRDARLVEVAIRQLAHRPDGPTTRDCTDVVAGMRSLHLRHARDPAPPHVRTPVHVIYYRLVSADLVEIVRVLHERMEPAAQLASPKRPAGARRRRASKRGR